jgi:hypothetical protein
MKIFGNRSSSTILATGAGSDLGCSLGDISFCFILLSHNFLGYDEAVIYGQNRKYNTCNHMNSIKRY